MAVASIFKRTSKDLRRIPATMTIYSTNSSLEFERATTSRRNRHFRSITEPQALVTTSQFQTPPSHFSHSSTLHTRHHPPPRFPAIDDTGTQRKHLKTQVLILHRILKRCCSNRFLRDGQRRQCERMCRCNFSPSRKEPLIMATHPEHRPSCR